MFVFKNMFHKIGVWSLNHHRIINFTNLRHMTTTEVSTALRPFYFSVHPDLFGQYPNQRTTNENSLKQLSAFLETLQNQKWVTPCNLHFYIRDKDNKATLRLIQIALKERDVREAVLNILKTCQLSTDYVDKIPKSEPEESGSNFGYNKPFGKRPFGKRSPFGKGFNRAHARESSSEKSGFEESTFDEAGFDEAFEGDIDFSGIKHDDPIFGPLMRQKIDNEKESQTLKVWIKKNHKTAQDNTDQFKPIRDKVSDLKKELTQQWGILDVRWECGWNENHYKACLQGLKFIAEQYPHVMHILRGRILVFAPFTGVSLEGHIMLNTGEVRHNWLDMIKNIRKYEAALNRIPAFEKSVSQVLRDIKVQRRKFMPKIMADEYERNLQQLTTSLSDYRGKRDFPKGWPQSLSDYQIVVETEAGPLMVSPTGQFIVPCSCPGFLLVKFITDNLEEASGLMESYKNDKHVERNLQQRCTEELDLIVLRKDDNVSPDLMIQCCKHLLEHKSHLEHLKGMHLNISTYYSVLSDGVVCIPWNWTL